MEHDPEKQAGAIDTQQNGSETPTNASTRSASVAAGTVDVTAIPEDEVTNNWQRLANKLGAIIGAEARGIERVDESLRLAKTTLKEYYETAAIWFSVNLTVCTHRLRYLV